MRWVVDIEGKKLTAGTQKRLFKKISLLVRELIREEKRRLPLRIPSLVLLDTKTKKVHITEELIVNEATDLSF